MVRVWVKGPWSVRTGARAFATRARRSAIGPAACAARVERKLGKLDGVRAAVNYATATALVTAPAGLPVPVLTAAVAQAGYAATARGEAGDGEGRAAGERDAGRDFAYLRRRLLARRAMNSATAVSP